MAKKIGLDHSRDPYPWDESVKRASAVYWTCCDMKLPETFYICPMCERERDINTVETAFV